MPQKIHKPGGGRTARRAAWTVGLLLALLLASAGTVNALAYFFAVPESSVDVWVLEDGTVTIDYYYLFENQPSGENIEYVDIGMPTTDYRLSNVTATIDGQPVFRVEDSTEVDNAIALNLGPSAIPPGQRGEVRARIEGVGGMLFKADTETTEPYGSFQFQPNFFGSQYITGRTDLTVTLHLPATMNENEPIYFTPRGWPGAEAPDQSGIDEQGRVFYLWRSAEADLSDRYTFGAAFPARLVPEGVLLTEVPFALSLDWICPALICLGFGGFIIFTVWAAITGERKRKLQYLPPRVAVEGNGIKRGLTPVEAAILMQQPMDKILTMALFSVIRKNAARVVSREPMKLEIFSPRPEGLQSYETDFLDAMAETKVPAQRAGLQEMMTRLVRGVTEKMRGFGRKETVAYYQEIMNKAWQQVEQAETPEMKMKNFDDALEWTAMDRRFEDRTREVFGPRPVIVPGWWGRYDPTFGRAGMGGMPQPTAGPSIGGAGNQPPKGVSLPTIPGGDFAASVVGGAQAFASNVVGDLTAFTGGVTQKTNPPPPPPKTGGGGRGGGGGGRSCACACACAGCACACAGGGR